MSPDAEPSSSVRGRETFELYCAPCHGSRGEGQYIGEGFTSPKIAGVSMADIEAQVRTGRGQMPTFGQAVITDAELTDLAAYVHGALANPPPRPNLPPMGLSEASPFLVGLVAWGALAALCVVLANLFGPEKN